MSERKVIITVAPTGSLITRKETPYLPITPEEVIAEACRSVDEGAAIIHLHARDPNTGLPTNDVKVYRDYVEGIRAERDVILQLTTGGGAVTLGLSPEERLIAVKELRPEMASLNAGSMNFGRKVFANPPDVIESYARLMKEWKVVPEFEIYDVSMINNVLEWVVKPRIMELPLEFGLVLGVMGGIPATPKNLLFLTENLPKPCTWQVIAIGRHQIPLGIVGVISGGNMRVGMEDNIYVKRGVLARSNAELVAKAVKIVRELGLEIASPDEAREILNIPKKV